MEAGGGPTAGPREGGAGWGESAADEAVTPGWHASCARAQPAVSPTANPVGEPKEVASQMFVPATPPAEPALAPVGVVTAASALLGAPQHTSLEVRSSELNVLEGRRVSVAGRMLEAHAPAQPGRPVALQLLLAHGWRTVALAHTGRKGRFRLSFTPRSLGSRLMRLRFDGDATAAPAHERVGKLSVFRLAGASWYGGGGGLACGGELTSSTLGVANKTLPCGTMVTLRYGDRSVRVPVVDRGPYVEGREFDLTEATKRALGFGDTGDVWSSS